MAELAYLVAVILTTFCEAVILALFFTVLSLIILCLYHCVSVIFSFPYRIYDDFYRYLAVGRGGTPPTFSGWCQVKILGFISREIFLADVFGAPFPDPMYEPYRGQLFNLPERQSPRPDIVGLVPQRQGSQWASPDTEAAIIALLQRKAAENPSTLVMERSFFEPHLCALKRRLPAGAVPGRIKTTAERGCEIAHAHHESSTHVVLHPADVAEVVRAGWGERHPLACCAEHWLWRFYYHTLKGVRIPLPPNFMLVYAPRDAAEMAMFERIVDAAIWFHTLPGKRENNNTEPACPGAAPRAAPAPAPSGPSPPSANSSTGPDALLAINADAPAADTDPTTANGFVSEFSGPPEDKSEYHFTHHPLRAHHEFTSS